MLIRDVEMFIEHCENKGLAFGEKIVTDLIYTRFAFTAQKNLNDMRYSVDMNKHEKKTAKINEKLTF